jgi:hypothetical protein
VATKSPKRAIKRKAKTGKQRRKLSKAPSRTLTGTYDSWLSKEAAKRHKTSTQKRPSTAVTADTFQEWMKRQTVTARVENVEVTNIPSTYDDWIGKLVATKRTLPEDTKGIEIVVRPTSDLVNSEKPKEGA